VAGKLEIGNFKMSWGKATSSYPEGLPTINGTILDSILNLDNITDEPVTIRRALKIPTVNICTSVRGKTVCSLPVNIIREEGNKKIFLTDHSAYYPLAHQPNEYMSSANFFLTVMLHADAWGNAYAYINRDSRNRPVSFDLWEPWKVSVTQESGSLFYTYNGQTEPARDILHFRWNSLDGICGLSPILENSNTMGMAIKLDRYQSLIMGARPPGILSYEGNLTPAQKQENKEEWSQGAKDTVKILSGRWHYESIMTQPEHSQFAEAKNMNQREIYGIYQTPPTFAQNFENGTYNNAGNSDLGYAKHTITPIIRVIEQECNMKLFFEREKANTYVKFNLNGILRGDIAARQGFYQAMVNTGVMSRNEARAYEDLNPYEGGDDFLVQGAMVPADMLREHYENQVLPTVKEPMKNYVNGHAFKVN
jgi:HK97 family phage portal protein